MSHVGGRRGWGALALLVVGAVAISGILWLMLNGSGEPPAEVGAPATAGVGAGGPAAAVGAAAAPAVLPAHDSSVVTGSGGGSGRTTVRGWPGQWVAFELPPDWVAAPGGPDDVSLVYYPVPGQEAPYVKVDLRRGVGLSGAPADDWPTGTTTTTLQVAGRPAVRYELPPETSELNGKVACQVTVAVLPPAGPPGGGSTATGAADSAALELRAGTHVVGVDTAADCAPHLAKADGLVQTIELLPDTTAGQAWTETAASAPSIPRVLRYAVAHPTGWTVTEGPDRVVLDGPVGASSAPGALHIEALPGQPAAYFEAAQSPLGAPAGLRWVASQVSGGQRVTEYALNDLEPTRWVVTGPDLPPGSAAEQALDQLVWRILLNSSFTYSGPPAYP